MSFNPNIDPPTPWRTIRDHAGYLAATAPAATYLMGFGVAVAMTAVGGVSTSIGEAFWFDPADYQIGHARQLMIRVRGMLFTNAVAPGAATVFTYGLYPIATFGGASGAYPTIATVSAATVSTPAVSAPGATSQSHTEAAAVNAPAAGWYALGCALSGASTAANANTSHRAELQIQ